MSEDRGYGAFLVFAAIVVLILFFVFIANSCENINKTMEKCREQAHKIIHISAAEAAASAAALSQFPGADNIALALIIGKMTIELSHVYDISLKGTAVEIGKNILKQYALIIMLRWGSQWLVGWIPGAGNAANATTMAALVEYIGWDVAENFERQRFGAYKAKSR